MNPVMKADNASFRRPPDRASKRQPDCRTGLAKASDDAPMTATALQNGLADGTIGPSPKAAPLLENSPLPSNLHSPKRPHRRA